MNDMNDMNDMTDDRDPDTNRESNDNTQNDNTQNDNEQNDNEQNDNTPNGELLEMNFADLDTSATELAALAALDACEDDEQATAELGSSRAALGEFRRVTAVLAESAAEVPPVDLRDQVLTSARARRTPGVPLRPVDPAAPGEAFRRTVADLHKLLTDLREDEWTKHAHESHGEVRDLIAHLIGIEESLLGILGQGHSPDPTLWNDHVEATAAYVAELRLLSTEALVDRWARSAKRLGSLVEEIAETSPERIIPFNRLPAGASGLLVLRTFEVWTHHEDICRATERTVPVLDQARLRRMSGNLMAALPTAVTIQGASRPGRTARVVLTGDGGGTFDVPLALGSAVGAPDVLIAADVVNFCRLAARRVSPAALAVTIEGDSELAEVVLVAAGAFALD